MSDTQNATAAAPAATTRPRLTLEEAIELRNSKSRSDQTALTANLLFAVLSGGLGCSTGISLAFALLSGILWALVIPALALLGIYLHIFIAYKYRTAIGFSNLASEKLLQEADEVIAAAKAADKNAVYPGS